MAADRFERRHIGISDNARAEMLETIGCSTIDELVKKTIPASILLDGDIDVSSAMTERDYLAHARELASQNDNNRSYIGMGYYGTITPPVILRNVLENPGWYTAYTPYQAEIAQGRLEALLNFQTMVSDLTGMEVANASLLDEGTAASEAMIMFYNTRSRDAVKSGANTFFISENCFPQTIDVVVGRAKGLNIDLVIGDHETYEFDGKTFGAIVQYPDGNGNVHTYANFVEKAHAGGARVGVASDLLALTMLTPPGEWGADCVFGNSQRFGVPMGCGGPHAAFFAIHEDDKRHMPGRIIGVSIDRLENPALRMALQTREQHIRRDKATSNICTAQALLAVMASMYACYHGADGLLSIAEHAHQAASKIATALASIGCENENGVYFDTLKIKLPDGITEDKVREEALAKGINFRYFGTGHVGISTDETIAEADINDIIGVFEAATGGSANKSDGTTAISGDVARTSAYLEHPVFNSHRSETEMMRYLKHLENKDLSLVHSMISLGSCTMKLNAAAEMIPVTWSEFANVHPFTPVEQMAGYVKAFEELSKDLCTITGFDAVSLQPNSGAQGEYAGLMVIRAYHEANGDHNRNVVLIPQSAHGTNPASAVMAGMKVVVVKCDENGNIDVADLAAKAEEHAADLSALMVTYPSTHGVFEDAILEVTEIIHKHGGQVYMDGANMNAQVGLTNPGTINADVCHLNLHKTFAIPHGGGGPGMGPIGVGAHLAPFLPNHAVTATSGEQGIEAISAAPWGSALILMISYGYIKMLGKEGLKSSTEHAILNANYLKTRLEAHYPVLYQGANNTVAHEMIVDCREFKKTAGIEVEDIAKRLIDYGFHAPTVSFPVAGTLMIEPTESESKEELDRFAEAMIQIRKEIDEVGNGTSDKEDNVLHNAPHTAVEVVSDSWDHAYSREKAAYPVGYLRTNKFWAPVARVNNAHGDRNLICICPPIEAYETEMA